MQLGRVTNVDVRSIWQHEAGDFTPWLARAENAAVLGEALRLGPLVVEATERTVGRFSADIIARDEAGDLVLIENQLEQTDHRHLGQVLTYLAGLEGDATVVWIATRFLEEHRAAVDWLNENTNERFEFFGVELRVIRIGDSEPAPEFNVVAKPNGWSRGVRMAARQVSEVAETDRDRLLLEYWTAFAAYLEQHAPSIKAPKPSTAHWKNFSVGKSGFTISVQALTQEKRIGAEIYIRSASAKADFFNLRGQNAEAEAEFGQVLRWDELPGRIGSRISVEPLGADPAQRDAWPAQHAWLLANVERFRRVFSRRIQALTTRATVDQDSERDLDEEAL